MANKNHGTWRICRFFSPVRTSWPSFDSCSTSTLIASGKAASLLKHSRVSLYSHLFMYSAIRLFDSSLCDSSVVMVAKYSTYCEVLQICNRPDEEAFTNWSGVSGFVHQERLSFLYQISLRWSRNDSPRLRIGNRFRTQKKLNNLY